MLLLKNETLKSVFNLPQTLDEVSFEYLTNCVKDIHVAPYRCIVAVVTKAKLRDLLDTKNNNAGSTVFFVVKRSVSPVKGNEDYLAPLNRKIYIAPSVVFQGIDCNNALNQLSVYNIANFIERDSTLRMSIMKGDIFRNVAAGNVQSVLRDTSLLYGGREHQETSLITTTAETAVIVGFKIIYENEIQGHNDAVSLKDTGITNFITPITSNIN